MKGEGRDWATVPDATAMSLEEYLWEPLGVEAGQTKAGMGGEGVETTPAGGLGQGEERRVSLVRMRIKGDLAEGKGGGVTGVGFGLRQAWTLIPDPRPLLSH